MPAVAFPVEFPKPETTVRVTLTLPSSLYDTYAVAGLKAERTPEEEIAERLKRCAAHTAGRPLYFNDDQRAALEKATAHMAINESYVLARLTRLLTLKVDDIKVELPTRVQERLRTRVFRGHTYQEVVRREIIQGLERYCGLRP